MKSLFYRFFYLIGKYLVPFRLLPNDYLNKGVDILYTGAVSRQFKFFGTSSVIKRKIDSLVNPQFISIGHDTTIGKRLVLTAWEKTMNSPRISIGNYCQIGDDAHITAVNKIQIGDNVLVGKKVTITDNSHGDFSYETLLISPLNRDCVSKGCVIIEDNVWIGDKVSILPNVRIGHNSVIGANSVVTKDIPPFSVAVGTPAIIKKRIKVEN